MRTFTLTDIEDIDLNFEDYKNNIYPRYLAVILKDARKNFKSRKPHVIAMKRKDSWSHEDTINAFSYNEHNLKLIKEQRTMIKYFECFIDFTEKTDRDTDSKNHRIMFSKDCIMKVHRIIAIYKATILTA